MNYQNFEATKDVSRASLFGAVSVILTYILNRFFAPPFEVNAAIIYLVWAGLTYADSLIHNTKTGKLKDINGLTSW